MEIRPTKEKLYAELGIIALKSFETIGKKIDQELLKRHRENTSFDHGNTENSGTFLIDTEQVRFSNGEGKVVINESVRGKDIYILCDIGNYSCTYNLYGQETRMGPDEHFRDLKRTLSAIGGKARRTTVVMPLLYASRQDKRRGRESLDCALALQEMQSMGIENLMTFDVHNPAVQNAISLTSFENLYPTHNIVEALKSDVDTSEKFLVISPDTGAVDRAIYYASIMGADVGVFYKRRDYKRIENGRNPIVQHEYMGQSVEGQSVLIVDDIISSGRSVLDIVEELKNRKAKKIYIAATFAGFTDGISEFNRYYNDGIISRVYSTNLSYFSDDVRNAPWFREVDMSGFIAELIDTLNYSQSVAPLLNRTKTILKEG